MTVIWVRGARGGLGTTTLAALLAAHFCKRHSTLLIDYAGGHLDVALGIESEPGMRWTDVSAGPDEAIVWALPRWGEVEVLSATTAMTTRYEAVATLGRDVVVVDAGMHPLPAGLDGTQVLLVGNDVLSMARAAGADAVKTAPTVLVVRRCPAGALAAAEIEQVLGVEVTARWRTDAALARAMEAGLGPVGSALTAAVVRRVSAQLAAQLSTQLSTRLSTRLSARLGDRT